MSFLTGIVYSRAAWVAATVVILSCTGEDGAEPNVGSTSNPSVSVRQTPLDGARIDKYVEAVPRLGANRVDGTATVRVDMLEFQQRILPAGFYASRPAPFNAGTYQWGY
jgi:hypothetical protein